ncbi:hypothetical protein NHF50_05170 [Flavobacterium sp. NRK F10]|uniref:Signal peptidase n=1 Tax=Flavobacterium sediminis TaxID=2201181 RepID=A0A2U8QT25_9FLAO|nr:MULTISPECIES: hypothetical protein [Flavobacterium]AWM13251.1 hypothetical protein DI487_04810 [Flavobacterium sediminis]MCO6174430.1 hypothetical protein [Flavobacterium sp. NRK F10]
MKLAVQKIVLVFVALLNVDMALAADPTPPPPTPPPPPGLPIDGGLVFLFFLALIFGYFISKKYISAKKSSF